MFVQQQQVSSSNAMNNSYYRQPQGPTVGGFNQDFSMVKPQRFYHRPTYNPGIFTRHLLHTGFRILKDMCLDIQLSFRHIIICIYQAQPFSQQMGHTQPVTITEQHRNVQHVNLRENSTGQTLGHSMTPTNLPGHRQSGGGGQ